jgi:hypothetical protein
MLFRRINSNLSRYLPLLGQSQSGFRGLKLLIVFGDHLLRTLRYARDLLAFHASRLSPRIPYGAFSKR